MTYLSGLDSLLGTLAILLIMAVSSWLQKKAEAQQRPGSRGRSPQPPRSLPTLPEEPAAQGQPPPQPARKMDWQEEVRRLLEGDVPTAEPPPVVFAERERPIAPPVIISPKPVVLARSMPVLETEEGPQSSRLTASAAAYKKAQQLHEEAAARLQQITEQTKQHKLGKAVGHRGGSSPEIAAAISLLRKPASARQAFVVSLVLSPPKGLES